MPDDLQELRRINLSEAFPFTQLFRSFRLAIHPHKLLLALVALILTYCLGRVMDQIWPATSLMPTTGQAAAQPGSEASRGETEIRAYIRLGSCESFCDWCDAADEACTERKAILLKKIKPDVKLDEAREAAESGRACDDVNRARSDAQEKAKAALETVAANIADADEDDRQALYEAHTDVTVAALIGPTQKVPTQQATASLAVLAKDTKICPKKELGAINNAIRAQAIARDLGRCGGRGIFATLLNHEIATFRAALEAVLAMNLGLGVEPPVGLKAAFIDAIGGIVWLVGAHWVYAVVFTILGLIVWSLFGGAICRIAALHAARDEKISFKQSLKFSGRKLLSFFSAPLIPIGLLVVLGAFVFLGGLLSAIPYVGEIFAGLLWWLALLGGFVMVLVIIGTVAGFLLMFPTIAVEGSDSFDALSRSFSYVYSKPWRAAFYVLVSGVYGAICYLFVRLFAHLLLNVTHVVAGLGMNVDGSARLPETVGKLEAIWTRTSLLETGRFFGSFGQYPLNGSEKLACFLITIWTFIVVGAVVSFVISFFFSSSTMIYYLLRREVDATDIEDVYLEEYEEDLAAVEQPPAEAPAAEAPGEQKDQAEEAPEAEPLAEQGDQAPPSDQGGESDEAGGDEPTERG